MGNLFTVWQPEQPLSLAISCQTALVRVCLTNHNSSVAAATSHWKLNDPLMRHICHTRQLIKRVHPYRTDSFFSCCQRNILT